MNHSVWCTAAVLLVLWLSGYPLARLLLPDGGRRAAEAWFKGGASLLLGCLLFVGLLYFPSALGTRWSTAFWAAVWVVHVGLALGAVWLLIGDRRRWSGVLLNTTRSTGVAAVVTGMILLSAAAVGGNLGLLGYDARAIYGLKAKVLAEQRTVGGDDFRDVHRLHFMPGYPLLVPILEAQVFLCSGYSKDEGLPLLFWGFLTVIAFLWASCATRYEPSAAGWLTFFCVLTPWLWKFSEGAGLSGSADIVLAAYLAAAAICAADVSSGADGRYALLCGLMLAGAMAVKQEGTLWSGLVLTTLALTRFTTRRRSRDASQRSGSNEACVFGNSASVGAGFHRHPLVDFGLVLLPIVIMFVLLRLTHGDIPRSPLYRSYLAALSWDWLTHCVGRVPQIASFAASECVNNVWGFGWGVLLLSLLPKRRYPLSTEAMFLRLLTMLGAASYLAVFVVTPYPLTYHLFTAFRRLMFHLYPLAMLVLLEQLTATSVVADLGRIFRLRSPPREDRVGRPEVATVPQRWQDSRGDAA